QLLDRPAGGDGRHPGVGHLRLPPGGGPAARPGAAAQVGRAPGALLLRGRPGHHRPGLGGTPPAVPGGAGLRVPDRGRGRAAGRQLSGGGAYRRRTPASSPRRAAAEAAPRKTLTARTAAPRRCGRLPRSEVAPVGRTGGAVGWTVAALMSPWLLPAPGTGIGPGT